MRSAINPTTTTIDDRSTNEIIINNPLAAAGLCLAFSWTRASMTGAVDKRVNPVTSREDSCMIVERKPA